MQYQYPNCEEGIELFKFQGLKEDKEMAFARKEHLNSLGICQNTKELDK